MIAPAFSGTSGATVEKNSSADSPKILPTINIANIAGRFLVPRMTACPE